MSSNTGDDDDRDQRCDDGGGGNNSGEIMLSSKKECISCVQNNTDNITEGIESVALQDICTCANCGKEGNSDEMNTCNKCKMVKYYNAACKKKHRTKHKKKCEKRVAELHDEQLFKETPPEECTICMLPMPLDSSQVSFQTCCGKLICNGCFYAMEMGEEEKDLCPFCRNPLASSDKEIIKRVKELMDKGNANAFNFFGYACAHGRYNMSRDWTNANESWLKAGELGCADGYFQLGVSYDKGWGVEVDKEKAKHFWELAAMNGNILGRHNLGCIEGMAGNEHRAMRHMIIAAKAGYAGSLDKVKHGFKVGLVTKDEYANTLRAYQKRQLEMKSDERDEAAIVNAEIMRHIRPYV